ncbi:D-serine ammonia-lyase [Cohaesibacter intestini]|uniref:D-serine ammonia-lyase n=1 Tax=Cohaesibacter intestini TaxID=2211145 RepID=UPI000DEB003F|nr:D-serine ammonia-lyase [Cohaesibacter intestini]
MTSELPPFANQSTFDKAKAAEPTLWCNPNYQPSSDGEAAQTLEQVHKDWAMLAPLLQKLFPVLEQSGGQIQSELIEVESLRAPLCYEDPKFGRLFVKGDHNLPVAGSVKARGGLFEVLMTARRQALAEGFLSENDDICKLASDAARAFFSQRTIAVGSTGNLGLSVGVAAKTLGYNSIVHMSSDAKTWKIERLRRYGVKVMQHRGDYNHAVAVARDAARYDPLAYFVDDEHSELLFQGYMAAAGELDIQLREAGIVVGPDRPLFLHLPCGIGGAPGGIAYGARGLFGAHVHCFFAEPCQSASAMLRMMHGRDARISVYDVGLTNRTEADGMAVATMSDLVAERMQTRLAGVYTVGDEDLFRWVATAYHGASLQLEPSATIGFAGPHFIANSLEGQAFADRHLLSKPLSNAIHVVWATGGTFVPELKFQAFVDRGMELGHPTSLSKETAT